MHTMYWSGKNFELNLSFGTLRDFQWKRLINALWESNALHGPLQSRYIPSETTPANTAIQFPAPTDTFIQHGSLQSDSFTVGIDVLVTRSLFECITISAPNGMFKSPSQDIPDDVKVHQVFTLYKQLAVALHGSVKFHIASIGWNRDCQLMTELEADANKCKQFFERGNFFATDTAIERLGRKANEFEQVEAGLTLGKRLDYFFLIERVYPLPRTVRR